MTELEKWTPSLLTMAPWVGVPGLPQDTAVRDTRTVRDAPGGGPVTEITDTGGQRSSPWEAAQRCESTRDPRRRRAFARRVQGSQPRVADRCGTRVTAVLASSCGKCMASQPTNAPKIQAEHLEI